MQADQEGDILELKTLLLALKKQQKQLQSRGRGRPKKGCPSGSEEVANGNGHCSMSGVKEAMVNGNGHGSSEQIENVVATGKGPSSGDPTQCSTEENGVTTPASDKAKKSQKRQREDEDPKSNGRKRTRAPLVELPPRPTRTRGCKETKVNHVELSSDDDFQ